LGIRSQDASFPVSISQRGDIPADTRLLTYNCFHNQIDVTINGTLLTGPSNNWGTSGILDVSPYAGQNVELKFTTRTGPFDGTTDALDDIRFMIPEPAPWLLAATGALTLAAGRRWLRHGTQQPTMPPADRGGPDG
jgi:hypothetical protein